MNFLKKLIGERCYLAPVNPEDTIYVAKWSNELEIAVNTGDAPDMISYNRQREYLEHMGSGGYGFLIILKDSDKPIGLCRLMGVDMINKRGTLGIFIGEKEYLSMGFGTEATKLILDYGFNILNLRNIMLQVYSFNERAIKSYIKCGFKEFGRRRRCILVGGKAYDEIYMDILAEEFEGFILDKIIK